MFVCLLACLLASLLALLCFALLCFALLCFALLCFALLCLLVGWLVGWLCWWKAGADSLRYVLSEDLWCNLSLELDTCSVVCLRADAGNGKGDMVQLDPRSIGLDSHPDAGLFCTGIHRSHGTGCSVAMCLRGGVKWSLFGPARHASSLQVRG